MAPLPETRRRALLERAGIQKLLDALTARGYRVVGPTLRDGAIVYGELASADELPAGWTDQQDGGRYTLSRREDDALFGYAVGPHSWKQFLHPPNVRLWRAVRGAEGFELQPEHDDPPAYAFLGVRSCELHAIAVQDRVLMGGAYVDPYYAARRRGAFLVAVNCGEAGGTCFCVSMGTGPAVQSGHDLVLTELLDGGRHAFLAEAGSERGAEVLAELPAQEALQADVDAARAVPAHTAEHMGRALDTRDLQRLLQRNPEHPRWDDAAARCLTCGNCTMVCPTCFCTTVEDLSDLAGNEAERVRRWDSCFTLDFSYVHGGSVRQTHRARYRQWMTHKLSTWYDQFGTSGCVGCGRCITWCPVGIDITEEAAAIRATDAGARGDPQGAD